MRSFFLCGMLAVVAAVETVKDAPAKYDVVVDLADGSRVVGAPEESEIKLESSYGVLKIPLKDIKDIAFQSEPRSVIVSLRNADTIHGKMDIKAVSVTALLGKVDISPGLVTAIRIRGAGETVQDDSWGNEVNGLKARLRPEKKEYRTGEDMLLYFEIKNCTRNNVSVERPTLWREISAHGVADGWVMRSYNMIVTAKSKSGIEVAQNQILSSVQINQPITLVPGGCLTVAINVDTRAAPRMEALREVSVTAREPAAAIELEEDAHFGFAGMPGTFKLKGIFKPNHTDPEKWSGQRLTTPEIEILVKETDDR